MPPVLRISPTNVESEAGWVVPLIQADFGMSMPQIINLMRQWAGSNDYCFIRSGSAVGLAMRSVVPLTGAPEVVEVFVYTTNPDLLDVFDVYRHFHTWARTSHAWRFRFRFMNDLTPIKRDLYEAFSGLRVEKFYAVDL